MGAILGLLVNGFFDMIARIGGALVMLWVLPGAFVFCLVVHWVTVFIGHMTGLGNSMIDSEISRGVRAAFHPPQPQLKGKKGKFKKKT